MKFGARAVIKLGALRHNLQVIRERAPGNKVMAVIKANAYGHGMLEVAKALSDADSLAVARITEARSLRAAGIDVPIVILEGILDGEELDVAVRSEFEIVVHCDEQLELLEQLSSGQLTVWLKFDTGMNRLGFPVSEADALIERAQTCKAITDLRLMSHLANADDRQDVKTAEQLSQFKTIAAGFDGDISIASSPGLFGWPDMAEAGVWVNCSHPGPTRTPRQDMVGARRARDANVSVEEAERRAVAGIPIGRRVEPEDIADWVLFLVSARAGAITGQTIAVEGGAGRGIHY